MGTAIAGATSKSVPLVTAPAPLSEKMASDFVRRSQTGNWLTNARNVMELATYKSAPLGSNDDEQGATMNDRDFKKIIDLLPKFQTDQEWLEQYRRDNNHALVVLGMLTAGIFIAIMVMAALSRF